MAQTAATRQMRPAGDSQGQPMAAPAPLLISGRMSTSRRRFLKPKLDGRTKKSAAGQLEQSLKRLDTDMIDLVQVHEVIRMNDPERVFGPGGTMEALVAAKQAGKLRFIGFTGHKDPAIHLHMLTVAAKN